MKRLLALIGITLGLLLSVGTQSAAADANRYWLVQMYQPAVTETSRSINVSYEVLSTIAEDSNYTVTLYQNETPIDTQTINHPYGNSGVFTVAVPGTGTFAYKISVANVNAGETKVSTTKTIQIVDEPKAAVTSVTVTHATSGSAGATTTNGSAASTSETAGTTSSENGGNVDDTAASTVNGKALGTKVVGSDNNASSKATKYYIIGVVLLAVAAGAYYWFVVRPRRLSADK